MVIIAMDASTFLEFRDRLSINLQPVVQLSRLDAKLGYTSINTHIHNNPTRKHSPS